MSDDDDHRDDDQTTDQNAVEADEVYDMARELAEKALEAYATGDKEEGDRLIEEAKEVDAEAVQDVYDELEEDAASEHDPAALNEELNEKPD